MLYGLPTEVTLNVLSYLPIPSLLSLSLLSRQWSDFFAEHKSEIFHCAALYHGYIPPGTSYLKDANGGRPLAGSTSWMDLCKLCPCHFQRLSFHSLKHFSGPTDCEYKGCRFAQIRRNWMGKGRAVARAFLSPTFSAHRIKVDEKAGICITTCILGGLAVTHLFSGTVLWHLPMVREYIYIFNWPLWGSAGCSNRHLQSYVINNSDCEYDNGYLVFDCGRGSTFKEVWRLTSDFVGEGEVAADAPPDDVQMAASAKVANLYHHYAPRGHFRPWALLRLESVTKYRLAYPTLACANKEHIFLYDVCTGSLVQTINIHLQSFCSVDVNERYVFVCELEVVHVFSRESCIEVLRIPVHATIQCSQRVDDPFLISGDWFTTPLSVSPKIEESPWTEFIAGMFIFTF